MGDRTNITDARQHDAEQAAGVIEQAMRNEGLIDKDVRLMGEIITEALDAAGYDVVLRADPDTSDDRPAIDNARRIIAEMRDRVGYLHPMPHAGLSVELLMAVVAEADVERAARQRAEAEARQLRALTEGDPYSIYYEAAEMRSELMHLRRWKLEATEVIESWELVYEALGDVGGLGQRRSDAVLAEVLRMKAELDRAQLRSIEASNPGIDMDEVRRVRSCECVHRSVQHDHIGCAVIGCDCPATNPRSTDE